MNQAEKGKSALVPKIFVVCDRTGNAPVWGYILRQQGLAIVPKPPAEKAIELPHRPQDKKLKKSEIVPY